MSGTRPAGKPPKAPDAQPDLLERCIALAVGKHAGQRDREGQPYILHVLRVMLRLPDETGRIAAVLHDLVEDTDVTLADLAAMGVPADAVEAVRLLTHEGGIASDDYLDHVQALAHHRLARTVKRADLLDKLDLARVGRIAPEDVARFERYLAALAILDGAEGGPPPSCPPCLPSGEL